MKQRVEHSQQDVFPQRVYTDACQPAANHGRGCDKDAGIAQEEIEGQPARADDRGAERRTEQSAACTEPTLNEWFAQHGTYPHDWEDELKTFATQIYRLLHTR